MSFSTGAQLVPEDNMIHVVETHSSTLFRVVGGRMLRLEKLEYCNSHTIPHTQLHLKNKQL